MVPAQGPWSLRMVPASLVVRRRCLAVVPMPMPEAPRLNASYDFRKILREAEARQCEGALQFSGLSVPFYGMLGRGAQKKSNGYFFYMYFFYMY